MKIAIILTALAILCIFAIAIFYPMYRKRREQKKLQAWRKRLKEGDTVLRSGYETYLLTAPDDDGYCKITERNMIYYSHIMHFYPLEGGEK